MDLKTALQLGRVSNLPTVWTNVLAATALAGSAATPVELCALLFALSAFYVGGMYLNDAFDREIDAQERPERPIPSGRVRARTVFAVGFGLLGLGVAVVLGVAWGLARAAWWPPLASALALAATIVFYDLHHKNNPLSPFIMGINRVLVYVTTATALTGFIAPAVAGGALMLLSYLIGLTYVAKQENLAAFRGAWPLVLLAVPFGYAGAQDPLEKPMLITMLVLGAAWTLYALSFLRPGRMRIPKAVASLIAGVSLIDGLLIATEGHVVLAGIAIAGFLLTLAFHRVIPGT